MAEVMKQYWKLIVVACIAIPVLAGGAAAVMLARQGEPVLRSAMGSLLLLWGLSSLFRLAAFGPGSAAENRSRSAAVGAGMVLLGAAQLAFDFYLRVGLGFAGVLVAVVVLIGRPKSLFGAQAAQPDVPRSQGGEAK